MREIATRGEKQMRKEGKEGKHRGKKEKSKLMQMIIAEEGEEGRRRVHY